MTDNVSIKQTNNRTRGAWEENWKDISVETVLTIFDYPRVKEMLTIYQEFLSRGGKILEAGCGLGPWLIEFTRLGYDVTGIDYDVNSVNKIKLYNEKLKVFPADVRDIPLKDESFDAYLSFGVFEHFAEGPEKDLKEASRVLRKGGTKRHGRDERF